MSKTKIIIIILYSIFVNLNCNSVKERDFWLSADSLPSSVRDCVQKMNEGQKFQKFQNNFRLKVNSRNYYKVENLLFYNDLNAYISYDSIGYYYYSEIEKKEYLLFPNSPKMDITIKVPISDSLYLNIRPLGCCNTIDSEIVNVFCVEKVFNEENTHPQTLIKVFVIENELISINFCGHSLSCYQIDFKNLKCGFTGIYEPCLYPEPFRNSSTGSSKFLK